MADETTNLLQFPTTTQTLASSYLHVSEGGVDKKISLADFITSVNGGNPFNVTIKEETSNSRTLTISDKNAYIRFLSNSQTSVTVNSAATDGWKKGDSVIFRKEGVGEVVLTSGANVTLLGASSGLTLTEAGQVGQLLCVDDNPTATVFDFVTGGNANELTYRPIEVFDPDKDYEDDSVRVETEDGKIWEVRPSALPIAAGAFNPLQWVLVPREVPLGKYDSKASMIADTQLSAGDSVETAAYYAGWASSSRPATGGARYDIVTKAEHDAIRGYSTVNEYLDATLATGDVALISRNRNTGTLSVLQCGAYNDASHPTETTAGCNAALSIGGKVVAPKGQYYLNGTLSLTVPNTEFIGESKVATIFGADPGVSTLGANNTIISIDCQPYNGSICNMRFKTFGVYTGWAITAGASINGFNGFSVTLDNLWNDFASSAAGFYQGGFYDGFCNNLQLDVTRRGFNLVDGGNRSLWNNINANGMFGEFMIHDAVSGDDFSYANKISNLTATNHVGNASATAGKLFRLANAKRWQLSNINYDAGNISFDPATGYNLFMDLTDSNVEITGCNIGVRRGVSLFRGFDITDSRLKISGLTVSYDKEVPTDINRLGDTFTMTGEVDVEVDDAYIIGGLEANFYLQTCSGRFVLKNSTVTMSSRRAIRTSGTNTVDITVKGSTLTDSYYNDPVASFQSTIFIDTSGDVMINNCTFGTSGDGLSGMSGVYDIRGAGPASSLRDNEYINFDLGDINESTQISIPANVRLSKEFIDDEIVVLPAGVEGMLHVQCGSEMAGFAISGSSTKAYGTTNTSSTNVDGNLCCYYSTSAARISNRLGTANSVTLNYEYR